MVGKLIDSVGHWMALAYVDCKMTDICSDQDERCLRLKLDGIDFDSVSRAYLARLAGFFLAISHGPNLIFCTKTQTQIEISIG